MASGIKVRINSAGARAVLNSDGVLGDLQSRAEAIAATACAAASPDAMRNAPFTADSASGGGRARARVSTISTHGIRNNNKYNTLLKSLDAGR